MPRVYETPPIVRDPYTIWLRTLLAGAILGAMAAALFAGWNYAWLTSRLQSVPRRRAMDAAYPYVTLAQAAFNWMSAWLLTTASPVYDPAGEGAFLTRIDRLRSFLIRAVLSALFIVWSLRMWGLFGASRLTVNPNSFLLMMTAADVAALLLLWLHLRRLAKRAKLRGMAWRAVVVLIVTGGCRLILGVGPLLAIRMADPWQFTFDQYNVKLGAYVLTSVMAMLAMGRFAWALNKSARTLPRADDAEGFSRGRVPRIV